MDDREACVFLTQTILWSRGANFSLMARKRQRRRRLMSCAAFRAAIAAGMTVERGVWCRQASDVWWSQIVGTFDDAMWLANLRVREQTFRIICEMLRPYIARQDTQLRKAVSVERRVGVALWWLATGSGFRTLAHLFGVGKSTVCVIVHEVCAALTSLKHKFIKLPTGHHLEEVVRGFRLRWGFPQCGGAIDGTHIPVIAPSDSHTDYFNRKGWHSVILQAISDHQYRFLNINVGWPGSVHDCRVLRNSVIYYKAERGVLFPPEKEIICGTEVPILLLGDAAYPLLSWLMKGYPETGQLSVAQQLFNVRLSRARMTIECAFGRLKGRWRCLTKRLDVDIVNVSAVVTACCVLHNVCEAQGEEYELEDPQMPEVNIEEVNTGNLAGPGRVREALTTYFQQTAI